ncbi:MAG TPA: tetratricopeptide repeat protein [Candidatus Sulfotelmatobacter sp.]|nr:tetratricopeptide repeat protein [Candidatus Sulfotelmatobacter sp.]
MFAQRTELPIIPALALIALSLFAVPCFSQTQPQSHSTPHKTVPAAKVASPLQQAEALIQQGSFEPARQIIEEQINLNPKSVEAYNLLGIIHTSEKNYGQAIDAFRQALTLAPNSTKTHNNLGNLYVAQQKPDLAEKEFTNVLSIAPQDRDANYNLGLLLLAKGEPVAAIPHFQRARPLTVETRFNLVRAYLQAGKTTQALQAAHELSAAHKQDVQLHFTLGLLLATAKEYKSAQAELEQANALQPETFEILHNLGQAYLRGHDYAKADLALTRALKLKPESTETLYLLGQVYFEQARPMDALELLTRAHKLAPENTDVIFLMARVGMTQNYFEDAIPLLASGLKLAPKRADLHAALGESYFMSGKTERAIEEFQKLIEVDPSARSYGFMGLSYRHLGRFDEALKYFQEGLKKDPHNSTCLFNIGYIEERQGNYARAEDLFQQTLRYNPDFPEALLELANLRSKDKKFAEAAELLRRFVKVSHDPADGYYKLAMAERGLHQMDAAQRDLNVFQTLSKNSATGPYPYQHLFDYLDNRANLSAQQRTQLDVTELTEQTKKHPGQPQDLYLLAETYLKLGQPADARQTIAQLDQISADDYRTQTGVGVLLARYRLYDDAIQHFQNALHANPDSDDVKFNLANAYFRKRQYPQALEAAQKVSAAGQQDDAFLALLADIEAHVGDTAKAMEIFRNAISRNPDNDQYYLSLTLLQIRGNDLNGAEQTLQKGLARIPGSGKLVWGQGLISVLRGNATQAAAQLERAVDLLPEWVGSYSTLGVFYYQTGQIEKAREVLNRFKGSNAGGLDVNRIEETLAKAPATAPLGGQPIPMVARQQLLQLALMIADRSL